MTPMESHSLVLAQLSAFIGQPCSFLSLLSNPSSHMADAIYSLFLPGLVDVRTSQL